MAEKRKKEKEGAFEFGPLSVSFGGLLKGIEHLVELAGKVAEKGGEVKESGEIKGLEKLGKGARGVYGFSIRTLGGQPVMETFGNIRETPQGPTIEEVREPIVDVFDEADCIRVIAEMPGVESEDIKIDAKGKLLTIKAERGTKKFCKEVELPLVVDVSTVAKTYKNGVVEIKFAKPAG